MHRAATNFSRRALGLDGWALSGLALLLVPLMVRLSAVDRLPVGLCVLKAATGVACPTCGATRAMGRLGALDLAGALELNPGVTLAWVVLASLALGRWAGATKIDLASWVQKRARWLVPLFLVALLANWVYVLLLQD